MLHENATQLINYILDVTKEVFHTLLKIAYNYCKYAVHTPFPPFNSLNYVNEEHCCRKETARCNVFLPAHLKTVRVRAKTWKNYQLYQ